MLELKKEFEEENDKLAKGAELKKVKQWKKIIEEFVQEFKKISYKRKVLVKEFKKGMSRVIRRELIKTERSSRSIE